MGIAGWQYFIVAGFAVSLMAADPGISLVAAAKNGDKEGVRRWIRDGASASFAEPDGATALHWASYRDDAESVELLIRAGANATP